LNGAEIVWNSKTSGEVYIEVELILRSVYSSCSIIYISQLA